MNKNKLTIKIAETAICIEHSFPIVRLVCQDYISEEEGCLFTVSVTEEEIEAALRDREDIRTKGEAENLLVFLQILRSAYRFQAMPLHAAVLQYEGKGYAFSAESGTGKSTHVRLWKEVFGDHVQVINGDKPFLKAGTDENGERCIRAYGTPWCGKEGQQINTSVPLAGLCFLERGRENSIRRLSETEAIARIFENTLVPECAEEAGFYLQFADELLAHVPVYLLYCNQDREAALTSQRGMVQ